MPESEAESQTNVWEPPVLAVREIEMVLVTLEDEEAGVFNDGNYSSLMVGGTIGCLGTTSLIGQIGPYHMYTNEALTDDQVYHNYNYFWESRYRWLSDSTVGAAINATNNSISY